MVLAIRGLECSYRQLAGASEDAFFAMWQKGCAARMEVSEQEFEDWSACQATPPEELDLLYKKEEGVLLDQTKRTLAVRTCVTCLPMELRTGPKK